ncbi:MAG: hypothetical protein WA817_14225, partial [Candidatus Acidiferrum sp.]
MKACPAASAAPPHPDPAAVADALDSVVAAGISPGSVGKPSETAQRVTCRDMVNGLLSELDD